MGCTDHVRKEEKLGLFVKLAGQRLPMGRGLVPHGGEDSCVEGVEAVTEDFEDQAN